MAPLKRVRSSCRPSSRQLLETQQQIRHLSGKPVLRQVKRTTPARLCRTSLFLRITFASRLHLGGEFGVERKQANALEPSVNLFQFRDIPDLLAKSSMPRLPADACDRMMSD